MGIEYDLYDHQHATYFDLGKGNWYELGYNKWVLREPGLFLEFVKSEMGYDDLDADDEKYYEELGRKLHRHFGNTPEDKLMVASDCGDHNVWAKTFGYVCIGCRYEPEQENIDYNNHRLNTPYYSALSYMSKAELIRLIREGWNISRACKDVYRVMWKYK